MTDEKFEVIVSDELGRITQTSSGCRKPIIRLQKRCVQRQIQSQTAPFYSTTDSIHCIEYSSASQIDLAPPWQDVVSATGDSMQLDQVPFRKMPIRVAAGGEALSPLLHSNFDDPYRHGFLEDSGISTQYAGLGFRMMPEQIRGIEYCLASSGALESIRNLSMKVIPSRIASFPYARWRVQLWQRCLCAEGRDRESRLQRCPGFSLA